MLSWPALHLSDPRALWILLLALPVLAAHLVRRRRVRLVVAHVALLVEARGAVRGAGLGRRVSEHLPLACRLLAVGALALALAGPRPRPPPVPVTLVLVVDADVTTRAREGDGRSRLAHALDLAAAQVRAWAAGPVSVVVAGAVPQVLAQSVEERDELARRLADPDTLACTPASGTTDLESALGAAWALAGATGQVRVLAAREVAPTAPPAARFEVLGTGAADDDQGFVDLSVTAAAEGPRTRVELTVRNFAPRPATREVVLQVDEFAEERRAVTLEPLAEAAVVFEVLVARGGGLAVVTLAGTDAFASDDRLEVELAGPLRPSVLVVHAGGGLRPYTAAAIAALGEQIDQAHSGAIALADLAGAAPRDVTVVDGAVLPPGALRPGGWLFLAPLGGSLPFAVAPVVERPIVWRARPGHPLAIDLDLADAWIQRATPLVLGPDDVGLAFAGEDQPVLAEGEREGVRWVALGLEPEASDLPMRAVFPLLLRNAILRLARAPAQPLPPFVRAGETLRLGAPLPGGPVAQVRWPGRAEVEARLEPDVGLRVPSGLSGLVEVRTGPPAAAVFQGRTAVVDLDRRRSIVPLRPPAAWPVPRDTAEDPGVRWVRWLVLLAGLLLGLDLLLARRVRPLGTGAGGGAGGGAGPHGWGSAGVALSPRRASIAPWKTESSARP